MMEQKTRRCVALSLLALTLLSTQGMLVLATTADADMSTACVKDFDLDPLGSIGKERKLLKQQPIMKRWLEDLPPMPPNHSPESEEWTNSIAVCAIMRDENLKDVMEWLRYYLWLGVDHVFLTDNDSSNSAFAKEVLTGAFPSTFLTFREEKTPKAQLKAYSWCAETHRESYNWMAFFDVDEYLVVRNEEHAANPEEDKEPDLKGFLNAYKMEPGLSINWIMVGPSLRKRRPEAGGVLNFYKRCVPVPDRHIKTIANTWFLDGVALHPHNFHFRGNAASVNEKFMKLEEVWLPLPINVNADKWANGQCQEAFETSSEELHDHCYRTANPLFRHGTVDDVALFHFATKSEEDFKTKMDRGSGMGFAVKQWAYYDEIKECGPPPATSYALQVLS